MTLRISIDDEAPDFDLSSTEDALLTLRDEVPRSSVVLYFFRDPESERVRSDLAELAAARDSLGRSHVKVLAVAPAKLPVLKTLQVELGLPFALLRDDRDFLERYGLEALEEGQADSPALYLVNRKQVVIWLENPLTSMTAALVAVGAALKSQGSPTSGYPASVINRLVDNWVN